MKKIDLDTFREIKNKIIEDVAEWRERVENDIYLLDEDIAQIVQNYTNAINTLTTYDLSDIDFEEWRDMPLLRVADIDLSKTKANIDFSIVEYESSKVHTRNFKGCQIKNFDFDQHTYDPEMFDEDFIKENESYFLGDEVPEHIRDAYYRHRLYLQDFSDNIRFFEGKKVIHSLNSFGWENKLIKLYGEDIYQLFADYKPIVDILINDYASMDRIVIPDEPITEEQRKLILGASMYSYLMRNGYEKIRSWDKLDMLLDFIPIENFPLREDLRELIEKYGIETLEQSGIKTSQLLQAEPITNLEEIENFKGIDFEDIKILLDKDSKKILNKYSIDKLLNFGIKDLSEILEPVNSLYRIRQMSEKIPIDLINMGRYEEQKQQFIKRYGIENIIALDEETGGMFSHSMWQDDIYLTMFAHSEEYAPQLDSEKELTYEEFRERMYEILLHSRDERAPMTKGDYPGYDFIVGRFRREHPEIFLDINVDWNIKNAFYSRNMNAEMVRKNPELIQLLQGKDLSRAFGKVMIDGEIIPIRNSEGRVTGGTINYTNMAQYLSETIGQEEFLKLCADYGVCLDKIIISNKDGINQENIRDIIEDEIYKKIKENGMEYFEYLPQSFHEKHPELYLPEEIDPTIRQRFYKGTITYDDIKENPELKEILLSKDLRVGFNRTIIDSQYSPKNTMWENLSESEILDFAEKYGNFLMKVNSSTIIKARGRSIDDIEDFVQKSIEYNIIIRQLPYNEKVPEFFKQKHPEMFLAEDAPEELKSIFYDNDDSRFNWMSLAEDFQFSIINSHPEWYEYLQGKDLKRAFSPSYERLFESFDSETLLRLSKKNAETIDKMVRRCQEKKLEAWYKATGGKFIPHHIVMLNFPVDEIDSFLANGRKWSKLMSIAKDDINDDGKTAVLKAAYTMGVFRGDDEGFNRTMKLFTDVPQELTQEEYDRVQTILNLSSRTARVSHFGVKKSKMHELFEKAYILRDDGKYALTMDRQKNKSSIREIREILEESRLTRILTEEKAHQIFDSFSMKYNPEFAKFFNENIDEILSNPIYSKNISTIQRQFKDIENSTSGRKITLDLAMAYISSVAYENVDIGNEGLAEKTKQENYSQADFEKIQQIYNEGQTREFSSIPRIEGKTEGYTYEMLRLDDPLASTIGKHTDCCQELHGEGRTSWEHSIVSPDGRVFVVRNEEGKVVAQSWFWRNQYVGCFDNIEIPNLIFKKYESEHPNEGREGLTREVLEVYKRAAQELMKEDARVYQELLENGTITKEQYDALLLGKVTIGLGYNDIASAIKADKNLKKDKDIVSVISTERIPEPYTDAEEQYIVAEREGTVKSKERNLRVHQDNIPVYDGKNMSNRILFTMTRMEEAANKDKLKYLTERSEERKLTESQRIINSIAREYALDPSNTKIMATARMAMIYSKEYDIIKIGELLSSPIKENITEELKVKAKAHIINQIKKALKQIDAQNCEVDLSELGENEQQIIQSVLQEITKEERGER